MIGKRVKIGRLQRTLGMIVHRAYLDNRRHGATGSVSTWVAGHGGDVWLVLHDGSDDVAAYWTDEMEVLDTDEQDEREVG